MSPGPEPGFPPLDRSTPLHPDVYDDTWWACTRPESPPDESTVFDWRCAACVLAAAASIANEGDRIVGWRPFPRAAIAKEVRLSWLVSRSRYWLEV